MAVWLIGTPTGCKDKDVHNDLREIVQVFRARWNRVVIVQSASGPEDDVPAMVEVAVHITVLEDFIDTIAAANSAVQYEGEGPSFDFDLRVNFSSDVATASDRGELPGWVMLILTFGNVGEPSGFAKPGDFNDFAMALQDATV